MAVRAEQEQPEHETDVDEALEQASAEGAVAESFDAQERLALRDRPTTRLT